MTWNSSRKKRAAKINPTPGDSKRVALNVAVVTVNGGAIVETIRTR